MTDFLELLTPEEKIVLTLRQLYSNEGYKQYRMSKFEEYDLYAKNKSFLSSDNIITFNDTDGRLLALKPDVTLSIIKNTRAEDGTLRAYYNENVYRAKGGVQSFREIMQSGVECIGDIGTKEVYESVALGIRALKALSSSYVLEVSHIDILTGVLSHFGMSDDGMREIIKLVGEKNSSGALAVLDSEGKGDSEKDMLRELISLHISGKKLAPVLRKYALNDSLRRSIDELLSLIEHLDKEGICDNVYVDLSVVNNTRYYNGIAFRGFVPGVARAVLIGGQYDKLLERMKRSGRAVGFAVYVDELARLG